MTAAAAVMSSTSMMSPTSVMASVVVTIMVVSMVMMAVPIVVLPFIVEPNSVVKARAYPNNLFSIVVIVAVFFDFNSNAYLGDLLRDGFFAVTC